MMTIVIVKYMPTRYTDQVFRYGMSDFIDLFPERLEEWEYAYQYASDEIDESAAEDAYNLTNDPTRQQERELCCGKIRSMSIHDIAIVDGVYYMCESHGWKILFDKHHT